jgi:hypothetical protein
MGKIFCKNVLQVLLVRQNQNLSNAIGIAKNHLQILKYSQNSKLTI